MEGSEEEGEGEGSVCVDDDDAMEFAEQQLLMQLFYDRKQQQRQQRLRQHMQGQHNLKHTGQGRPHGTDDAGGVRVEGGDYFKGFAGPDPLRFAADQTASFLHHTTGGGGGGGGGGAAPHTPQRGGSDAALNALQLQQSASKQVCGCGCGCGCVSVREWGVGGGGVGAFVCVCGCGCGCMCVCVCVYRVLVWEIIKHMAIVNPNRKSSNIWLWSTLIFYLLSLPISLNS